MDRQTTLHKASEIARSLVTVGNALMGPGMATYQPERDTVEFYLYDYQGDRVEHFRFEATRHEYVIHDVLADAERSRTNTPDRALGTWASHILGYLTD